MSILSCITSVFNWQTLPAVPRRWLFSTGTTAIETLSGLGLLGYALIFWLNGGAILEPPIHYRTAKLDLPFSTLVFAATGLTLLALSGTNLKKVSHKLRNKLDTVTGFVLIFSGLLWFLIAVAFMEVSPPYHTGPVLSGILSIIAALGGDNLLKRAYHRRCSANYCRKEGEKGK